MTPAEKLPGADRLRWQCRRGMLELDYLLEAFLLNAYDDLPDEQKRAFIHLLGFEDQLLHNWLMGYEQPADSQILTMVETIRAAL